MVIKGSICALATSFHADGSLDFDAFGRLIDYQIEGGTQALVVAGSTGEAHMLEDDEFDCLLNFARDRNAGRVPLIVGTGEAGTAKTIHVTQHARDLGMDAALVVTPYYVRPTQDGMRRHFLEVAEHGGLPLLLYNVPTRTACDLLPITVARLCEHPAIMGIKDASHDIERIQAMSELASPDFVYLSGDDITAGVAMLQGAAGAISVVANLVPGIFRALCDAATGSDPVTTSHCHAALLPLLRALQCAPNPVAVKAGLSELGIGSAHTRLPLVALEEGPAWERLRVELATLTCADG